MTQTVMPMLFGAFMSYGAGSWRLAMVVPDAMMLLTGIAYWFLTQDTPSGSWRAAEQGSGAGAAFREACRDKKVWGLAVLYAACLGMELTIDNIARLYFVDTFHLSMGAAGIVAGTFGMMNIFARALGGIVSDWCHRRWGLNGRTSLLGITIGLEGLALICFAMAGWLPAAIGFMLLSGLFIKMPNGATYAVVPFVNRWALGTVAGIVGAGGNVGAVFALAVRFAASESGSELRLPANVVPSAAGGD